MLHLNQTPCGPAIGQKRTLSTPTKRVNVMQAADSRQTNEQIHATFITSSDFRQRPWPQQGGKRTLWRSACKRTEWRFDWPATNSLIRRTVFPFLRPAPSVGPVASSCGCSSGHPLRYAKENLRCGLLVNHHWEDDCYCRLRKDDNCVNRKKF